MTDRALTLDAAMCRGRNNNFDVLRLVAAFSVVISHAWPLALGAGATEPLEAALGMSLGGVAVLVFFFISGLLVTHSAHRNINRPKAFVLARVGRIFPGLLVALLVTVLIASLSSGTAFPLSEITTYILRGATLISLQHSLTGAYAANPVPMIVNGPLWTLFYEVGCYAILAAAVWAGLLRHWVGWLIAVGLVAANWAAFVVFDLSGGALAYRLSVLAPLAMAFLAGAVFWKIRAVLVLNWQFGTVLAVAAFFARDLLVFFPLFVLPLGYGLILLAYRVPTFKLRHDFSYGIYIYGWPVAQAVLALWGPLTPFNLAMLSCLAVLPFAMASWFIVEKPALTYTIGLVARKPAQTGAIAA